MPIRDIVTRGFGNGTFSPGVNRLPVRGYSIEEEAVATPFDIDVKLQTVFAGAEEMQAVISGSEEIQIAFSGAEAIQ